MLTPGNDRTALWTSAERYLGAGTRNYSRYSAEMPVSADYHPQGSAPGFQLPTFWVDSEHGEYRRTSASSPLHDIYSRNDRLLLPVHPDTLALPHLPGRDQLLTMAAGPVLDVMPLANARTVLVLGADGVPTAPHFLKLHFPQRISRFHRTMNAPDLGHELWTTTQLHTAGLPVLRDLGGGLFGRDPDTAWGYLVRDSLVRDGHDFDYTVPLFALYGNDIRSPDRQPLLHRLVTRAGVEPAAFLAEHIIEPMIAFWVRAVFSTGCLPELHGQNTLLSFTRDGRHSRIAYRDGGIYTLAPLRHRFGHSADLPPMDVVPRDVAVDCAHLMSLVYDSFMGHHALTRLNTLATDLFGFDPDRLPSLARKTFADNDGTQLALPRTVYYYDGTCPPDQGWRLADTGQTPTWR
ncbi:hypothetical protein OIE68_10085 [Nocardia vinacea]|uniref:Uncharacterized protein n=1 Tax=Nocardia vinacea TaxID=96468 RepID=A0ABZ1YVC9_9NOCA|nr:hypothetical protein OIE68_10085 [Nocardia vinacea]